MIRNISIVGRRLCYTPDSVLWNRGKDASARPFRRLANGKQYGGLTHQCHCIDPALFGTDTACFHAKKEAKCPLPPPSHFIMTNACQSLKRWCQTQGLHRLSNILSIALYTILPPGWKVGLPEGAINISTSTGMTRYYKRVKLNRDDRPFFRLTARESLSETLKPGG